MALTINEIFYSIQGESTWAGLPFVFIRLTGCNLRCRYCDTQYAYTQGTVWSLDKILAHVTQLRCQCIAITGGEPLLQTDTPLLVQQLIESGFMVTMETNGSQDVGGLDPRCIKVLDVKCPSSGMMAHNFRDNLKRITRQDQVKFVIADRADFEFACKTSEHILETLSAQQILFSPVYGVLAADELAQWMLDGHIQARLQIQLHKYLWPHVDRGR